MPIAKGTQSKVGFVEESTFGTTPGDGFRQFPLSSETLDENINTVESQDIQSSRATPTIRGGNKAAGGSITSDMVTADQYIFWNHLLGGSRTVSSDVSPTHDLTAIANNTVAYRGEYGVVGTKKFICLVGAILNTTGSSDDLTASFTSTTTGERFTYADANNAANVSEWMAVGDSVTINSVTMTGGTIPTAGLSIEKQIIGQTTPIYVVFRGCRINSVDMNIQQEPITQLTWNLLATRVASSGSAADSSWASYTPDESLAGLDGAVFLKTYDGSYDGLSSFAQSTKQSIQQASFSMNNQFDETVFELGERFRTELPEGVRRLSGRLSAYFVDDSAYTLFQDEIKGSLKFSFINNGDLFELIVPEVKVTGQGTPKVQGPGVVIGEYEVSGFQAAAAYDVKVRIHSTKSFS